MVRRGATPMFILSKSFAFCSEGIPSGKDAPPKGTPSGEG